MEHTCRVAFIFVFFSGYFCLEGIRLSGKRMIGNTQLGNMQDMTNPSYRALLEAARDGFLSPDEISEFAPDTPSPNDVECYVDVETYQTRRVGGKCVNFGRSNLRICQAGQYSGPLFSSQCSRRESVARDQETTQTTP